MGAIIVTWVALAMFVVFTVHVSADDDPESLLIRKILSRHDPKVRPVTHPNDTVVVTVGLSLTNIVEFDTENNILTIHGWINMYWQDAFIPWNVEDHGITDIRLPPHSIWTPDIRGYNTINEDKQQVPMVVYWTGDVWYSPPTTMKVQCHGKGNPSYYCALYLGPWTYGTSKVTLWSEEVNNGLDMTFFECHPRWNVTSATATRNVHQYDEPYESWQMNITITDLHA